MRSLISIKHSFKISSIIVMAFFPSPSISNFSIISIVPVVRSPNKVASHFPPVMTMQHFFPFFFFDLVIITSSFVFWIIIPNQALCLFVESVSSIFSFSKFSFGGFHLRCFSFISSTPTRVFIISISFISLLAFFKLMLHIILSIQWRYILQHKIAILPIIHILSLLLISGLTNQILNHSFNDHVSLVSILINY